MIDEKQLLKEAGKRLASARARVGYATQKQFAEAVDLAAPTIAKYEQGVRETPMKLLRWLSEQRGVNADWIISGEGDVLRDFTKAPVPPVQVDVKTVQEMHSTMERLAEELLPSEPRQYGRLKPPPPPATVRYLPFRASAGGGAAILYESDGVEMDLEALANHVLGVEPKFVRLLEIKGDSMLPTLHDRDLVVFDISDPKANEDPQDGKIYVISHHGELLAKRAKWQDDGDTLLWCSDNDDERFSPIEVSGDDFNRVWPLGRVVWMWRAV